MPRAGLHGPLSCLLPFTTHLFIHKGLRISLRWNHSYLDVYSLAILHNNKWLFPCEIPAYSCQNINFARKMRGGGGQIAVKRYGKIVKFSINCSRWGLRRWVATIIISFIFDFSREDGIQNELKLPYCGFCDGLWSVYKLSFRVILRVARIRGSLSSSKNNGITRPLLVDSKISEHSDTAFVLLSAMRDEYRPTSPVPKSSPVFHVLISDNCGLRDLGAIPRKPI